MDQGVRLVENTLNECIARPLGFVQFFSSTRFASNLYVEAVV